MKKKYYCLPNSSNNKYLRADRYPIYTIIYCEKSLFSNENHAHIFLKRKKREKENNTYLHKQIVYSNK